MLVALLAALVVLTLAGSAAASSRTVRVGIADTNAATLEEADFERLGVKRMRYIIRWNAIDHPPSLARADAFVQAARREGIDVLLHFSTDDYTPHEGELPSRSEYRRKVGALVDRWFPLGVREWGVWNEANDRTQPTHRNPGRAADFFVELWRLLDESDKCGSSVTSRCRVVALDLLDGRSRKQRAAVRSYVRRFYRRLGPTYDRRGRFVGIHNYSDTNRRSMGGTRNAIAAVDRYVRDPVFWLTETGGIVKLGDDREEFACDPDSARSVRRAEARADRAARWMLRLAKRFRRDIDRLYVYRSTGVDCKQRFDAGLVRVDRSRRPAWYEVFRGMRDSKILTP